MLPAEEALAAPELVVLSGHLTGQRLSLPVGRHLLGRAPTADVSLAAAGISRHHAELIVSPTGCFIRDLRSTNGTAVNGARIDQGAHPLSYGDRIDLGRAVTLQLEEPGSGARTAGGPDTIPPSFDPMTGAYDRKHLSAAGELVVASARRRGQPLAMALVDIEQLAAINTAHGPAAGDEVLKNLARHLGEGRGPDEILARFEDDMFVLVAPATDAEAMTDRLQRALRGLHITSAEGMAVLVRTSAGVSALAEPGMDSALDLFLAAARRLRCAKLEKPGTIRHRG